MSGRAELRAAIQAEANRHARDASAVVQMARVTAINELTLEMLETGVTLHTDEFDLTQAMRAYTQDTGLTQGDTVLIVRKRTGGEIHWILFGVLSDSEISAGGGTPTGPAGGVLSGTFPNPGFAVDMATQAELDALQAEVDALELTDFRYVHIQSTPSASWVINHNLGTYPDVEVIDSSGAAVLATVDHPDANNTVISFIGATAGRAILS